MRERARRRERQRRPRTITGREANRQAATGCSLLAACCSIIAANLMLKPLRAPHSSLLPGLFKLPGLPRAAQAAACCLLHSACAGQCLRPPDPISTTGGVTRTAPISRSASRVYTAASRARRARPVLTRSDHGRRRRVFTRLHDGRASRIHTAASRARVPRATGLGCGTPQLWDTTSCGTPRAPCGTPRAVGHLGCGTPRA